jgi:hypothetical protein
MVKFPVAALAEAAKTTGVLAPEATLKGLDGLEVTPEGSALSATCTTPEKPFNGLTVTLTGGLEAFCAMEIELDDRLSVKSAAGGGGGGGLEDEPPQLPQINDSGRRTVAGTPCGNRPMR